jgi:hypothetical protein
MPPRSLSTVIVSLIWLCCLVWFACAGGCQPAIKREGALERRSTTAQISSRQLRVMVNEFVVYYANRVELTADKILAQTTDPAVRRNALLWKINGISSCLQSASRSDPLGAYLDIWILNRQVAGLFDTPPGNTLFGPAQPLARAEVANFETRLQYINQTAGADLPLGEKFVTTFASDFPLKSLYFDREPIASRYIQEVQPANKEMFQVVADLEENLIEMRNLSVLYAEYLPKQARWESELLLMETSQQAFVQQPIRDFSLAAHSIAQIAHTSETLPQTIEHERAAFEQIVAQERETTLAEVERMRQETLAAVTAERAAVLVAVHDERLAISRQLDEQVAKALVATDDLSRQRVDQLAAEAPAVIDHFFRRAVQFGGVLALLVIAYLLVRRRAQPRIAHPQPTRAIRGDFSDDRASAA